VAAFGSGKLSDPVVIGAVLPFDIEALRQTLTMCLPAEQHLPEIQAREDQLQTLLPIGCDVEQMVKR